MRRQKVITSPAKMLLAIWFSLIDPLSKYVLLWTIVEKALISNADQGLRISISKTPESDECAFAFDDGCWCERAILHTYDAGARSKLL